MTVFSCGHNTFKVHLYCTCQCFISCTPFFVPEHYSLYRQNIFCWSSHHFMPFGLFLLLCVSVSVSVSVSVCVCLSVCELLSGIRLFVIPGTVACQVLLSMEFSRQEYGSGLPFPSPRILPIHTINNATWNTKCRSRQTPRSACTESYVQSVMEPPGPKDDFDVTLSWEQGKRSLNNDVKEKCGKVRRYAEGSLERTRSKWDAKRMKWGNITRSP